MTWQSAREQLKSDWMDLERTYDELRVQAHLLGMTAKQELSNLEPMVRDAKGRIGALSQETVASTRSILGEVRQSLERLRDEVKRK